jgi:hypothetical protein
MSEHAKAQAARFARMVAYAVVGQLLVLGHWPGWAGLWALAPAVGETLLRELLPVKPLPAIAGVLASASPVGAGVPPGRGGVAENPPGSSAPSADG